MTSGWRPLLDGSLLDRAHEAIRNVADALPDPPASRGDPSDLPWSLSDGAAGLAVLAAYLSQSLGDSYDDASRGFLDYAVEEAAKVSGPSLHEGYTGVAWAAEHLQEQLYPGSEEDSNEEVDAALVALMERPWERDFDLIGGLVGFGVYALERLPRPSGELLLALIADRLDATAERTPEGITWVSRAEWVSEEYRARHADRHYNLGLAHGVPGVVALLGRVRAAGVAVDRATSLLDGAVSWLLSQQIADPTGSCFPSILEPGTEPKPARTAWCYGDPGIAVALLSAARARGNPAWEQEAIGIARTATRRPLEHARAVDAGLCHGAAGLGHLFNRLFQATGDELLEEAAAVWFERALDMRDPDARFGGFRSLTMEPDGRSTSREDAGFLTGTVGVALGLLAATTSVEPNWDRVLLAPLEPTHETRFPAGV